MDSSPQGLQPEGAERAGFNIGLFFTQAARRCPDRVALVVGERQWTFVEIDRLIERAVAALTRMGLRQGDRVLVQAQNSAVLYQVFWAVWQAGGVLATLNSRLSPPEVSYAAKFVAARYFICDRANAVHAAAALRELPDIEIIWTSPSDDGRHFGELLEGEPSSPRFVAPVAASDPCSMFFTSGTTGRPKGALFGHGHMSSVLTTFVADILPGLTETDVYLAAAPLSHGAGIQMAANVTRAAATVLPESPKLNPAEVWRLVERHRVTNVFTVPTILKALVEHPTIDRHDHSSLKQITYSGSPMYRADQRRALEKLGPVLVQFYGSAEVTAGATVLPPRYHSLNDSDPNVGSCGYARTGIELSIQDEDGNRLPAGVSGEVCVQGQNVFLGYFHDPEANRRAFRGGWFRTGDFGLLDERGFLFLNGRAADMFISGGNNIYPIEVENVLLSHPAIREASVFGLPDAYWGEVGVGVLVVDRNCALTEDDIFAVLEGRIAKYKWPRKLVFWDELPKSAYGKIPKNLVRDEYLRRLAVKTNEAADVVTDSRPST